MSKCEDGIVLINDEGYYVGEACATPYLQQAKFVPMNTKIDDVMLQNHVVLAASRTTTQEVLNAGHSQSDLVVVYHATANAFYSDVNFDHVTPDLQKAYVFDRAQLSKTLLHSANFIFPVRLRSVNTIKLYLQQPEGLNPHKPESPFFALGNDTYVKQEWIDQISAAKAENTLRVPVAEEDALEAAAHPVQQLAPGVYHTTITDEMIKETADVAMRKTKVLDTAGEGPIVGVIPSSLEQLASLPLDTSGQLSNPLFDEVEPAPEPEAPPRKRSKGEKHDS